MISQFELSIVFQGPIVGDGTTTWDCIESARRVFPDAEIILSTWRGPLGHVPHGIKVVQSNDPGGYNRPGGGLININRQIVSTMSGLHEVSRRYAAKVRTDCLIEGDGFLRAFESLTARRNDVRIFDHRIVSCCKFFRNPRRYPMVFHCGDLFHFGLSSDLMRLWDIPAQSQLEAVGWEPHFSGADDWKHEQNWTPWRRHNEEQHLWISCLNKWGNQLALRQSYQQCDKLRIKSEQSLINNFSVHDEAELCINFPNRKGQWHKPEGCYTVNEWHLMYKDMCVRGYDDWSAPCPSVVARAASKISTKAAGCLRRVARKLAGIGQIQGNAR
jgi:hypothetical protein